VNSVHCSINASMQLFVSKLQKNQFTLD